jgi:phosphatidylglycerol:prolipoprotein diacylglycerol transferase
VKPILLAFELGGTTISLPSYGVAVSLAIVAVVTLVARRAPRMGLSREAILDLSFLLLLAGLGGSRLLYVLLNAGDFAALCAGSGGAGDRPGGTVLRDCLAPLRLWDGGLVFYGGALTAAAVAWRFGRKRGWRFAVLGDLFGPALALGHAIGRFGCFFAGCCFGQVCDAAGPPCVQFPPGSIAHEHLVAADVIFGSATLTPPLHPTALYEIGALLLLYFALLAYAPRKRFHGELLILYVLGYAGLRMVLELFRGDLTRQFLFQLRAPALAHLLGLPGDHPLLLSTSQAMSVVLAAAAVTALWLRRRARIYAV